MHIHWHCLSQKKKWLLTFRRFESQVSLVRSSPEKSKPKSLLLFSQFGNWFFFIVFLFNYLNSVAGPKRKKQKKSAKAKKSLPAAPRRKWNFVFYLYFHIFLSSQKTTKATAEFFSSFFVLFMPHTWRRICLRMLAYMYVCDI